MSKAEMNKKVSEVTGLSQKDVDAVIAAYVGVVIVADVPLISPVLIIQLELLYV